MAGCSPTSAMVTLFLLLQLDGNLQLNESCSIFCPDGEITCTCPNDKSKSTTFPPGLVITDSCGGFNHYCSKDGECNHNECPVGKNEMLIIP